MTVVPGSAHRLESSLSARPHIQLGDVLGHGSTGTVYKARVKLVHFGDVLDFGAYLDFFGGKYGFAVKIISVTGPQALKNKERTTKNLLHI